MKTRFLLAAIPAALLSLTAACDNDSAVIECGSDADCPADAPVCDLATDPGVCVPAGEEECAENLDCQILDGADGAGCGSSAECPDDEGCAEGFNGEGFCLVTGDQTTCDLVDGFTSVSLPEAGGGGNIDVCVAEDGTCTNGACDL